MKPAMSGHDRRNDDGDTEIPVATPSVRRNRESQLEWVLEQVRNALEGLRFGTVTITVQDGVPIQIERNEKTRLR